ncbi:MAG: hypothetical protein QXW70_03810 [Candidatus Anstonellales archaeon]
MKNTTFSILSDRRILLLVFLTLAALLYSLLNGIKFGIDFSGGTRIPVVLETGVDSATMLEMVESIKTRTATLGLTEVKVRGVGNSQIYVEVPSSDPALVSQVQHILSQQGVYEGIIDGRVAIKGDDIFAGTIVQVSPQFLQGGADWGVSFTITQKGALRFAQVAKGKANYPLFMFLDRPKDSIIIMKKKSFLEPSYTLFGASIVEDDLIKAAEFALNLSEEEGGSIQLYFEEDFNSYNQTLFPKTNKTRAIIESSVSNEIKATLTSRGFQLVEKTSQEIVPEFVVPNQPFSNFRAVVSKWSAVGLLSSPYLVPSVTTGAPSYSYQITGPGEGTGQQRVISARQRAKEIESILKGGAFPVQISLGSTTTIPAPLGREFLKMSIIGAAIALVLISLLVALRYRNPRLVLPVIFISISEMIILVSFLGAFSIDLGTMAGIIAAIGVSVDAQVVVTDELLKRGSQTTQKKLQNAFSIILTNATVAVIAMVPLLFSGMVEIIGFATAHVSGSLLGVLISRPAYSAIVEKFIHVEE